MHVIKPSDVNVESIVPVVEAALPAAKMKKFDVYMTFVDLLQHKPLSSQWQPFPFNFHVIKDETGEHEYIEEQAEQVVRSVSTTRITDSISKYFREKCFHAHATNMTSKEYNECMKHWAAASYLDPSTIALMRFKSESGFTWNRVPFDPTEGPFPAWNEFLVRLSNRDAFMKWVGSIFDPNSSRKHYVYLHGDGDDGKSKVLEVLYRLFGHRGATYQAPQTKDNQFWTSGLIGKRLVLFDDFKDQDFLISGLFKSLSGGSDVRIEIKGGAISSVPMIGKYIFSSNEPPNISLSKSDLQRIIYCKLKPLGAEVVTRESYKELLWDEMPFFLQACIKIYRNQNHLDAQIDNAKEEITAMIESYEDEPFENMFESNFVVDPKGTVPSIKLQEALRKAGIWDNRQTAKCKAWLKRVHKIERTRPGGKVWVYSGMREKYINTTQPPSQY